MSTKRLRIGKPWTLAELNRARELAKTHTLVDVDAVLGRASGSTNSALRRYGIERVWTFERLRADAVAEREAELRAAWEAEERGEQTHAESAAKLGVTEKWLLVLYRRRRWWDKTKRKGEP